MKRGGAAVGKREAGREGKARGREGGREGFLSCQIEEVVRKVPVGCVSITLCAKHPVFETSRIPSVCCSKLRLLDRLLGYLCGIVGRAAVCVLVCLGIRPHPQGSTHD